MGTSQEFHPRGTLRVGLFSLDFLWFFLVSRQERTCKRLFAVHYFYNAMLHPCSLNVIACIAIHVGIIMLLQILRPYGAVNVVRCSLFVARCTGNCCHAELAEASLFNLL